MADKIRDSDEEPAAPTKLVTALQDLPIRRIAVPHRVDEAILRAGRERLCTAARVRHGTVVAMTLRAMVRAARCWTEARQLNWRRPAPWAAAAALLVVIVLGLMALAPHAPAIAEDLNHDGQVDMLDAFALARQVQHGDKPGALLDLNGDGVVDERDVEELAARAVRLEKPRKS